MLGTTHDPRRHTTVLLGITAYFALANGIDSAPYLTERERAITQYRHDLDGPLWKTALKYDGIRYVKLSKIGKSGYCLSVNSESRSCYTDTRLSCRQPSLVWDIRPSRLNYLLFSAMLLVPYYNALPLSGPTESGNVEFLPLSHV